MICNVERLVKACDVLTFLGSDVGFRGMKLVAISETKETGMG